MAGEPFGRPPGPVRLFVVARRRQMHARSGRDQALTDMVIVEMAHPPAKALRIKTVSVAGQAPPAAGIGVLIFPALIGRETIGSHGLFGLRQPEKADRAVMASAGGHPGGRGSLSESATARVSRAGGGVAPLFGLSYFARVVLLGVLAARLLLSSSVLSIDDA